MSDWDDWDDFESDDEDFDAQEYFETNFTINGQPIRFDNSSSDDTTLVGEAIDSAIAGTLSGVSSLFKKAKNALASSGSKENPTEKVDEDQAVIEKEPPLTEIFVAMLKELEDEIQQAAGFAFSSEKYNQSYNLEKDLLDGEGQMNIEGDGTIYAWVLQYVTKEEWLIDREFEATEVRALFQGLINGCGLYGHRKGLRISGFIEYAATLGDPYLIDEIMKLNLKESYAALEINSEMADFIVSNLSGEMLSLMMKEDLSGYLVDCNITKGLYVEDKYAWVQNIKDAMNELIAESNSTKLKAVTDSASSLNEEKEEAQPAKKLSTNEMAKKLFNSGNLEKNNGAKSSTNLSPNDLAKELFKNQSSKPNSVAKNESVPKNFIEERTTLGLELTIFDINKENFELGAKTVLCALLNHFTQQKFDPDLLQPDDLLMHLCDLDKQAVVTVSTNVCNHFQEIGNLHNPEIQYTPNDPEKLKVKDVIAYAEDMVNDPDSAYVRLIEEKK